jgi:hypothetical protein
MARNQKLKVYRTPIGFHDAYVAAPSQKAALEAWGSDANLFARGVAELVTDENLMREPLDHPGAVIRRLRGSEEEQLAALPPDRRDTRKPRPASTDEPSSGKTAPEVKARRVEKPKPKPKPRPPRDALQQAERNLDQLLKQQASEEGQLRERERQLERERRDLERTHSRDRSAAERLVDKEREAHSSALNEWMQDQR